MLHLSPPENNIKATVQLSGSKSISNRLLILNEVLNLGAKFQNLSTSEDTRLLQKALEQIKNTTSATIDIGHAGTDMRFLTAFLSAKEGNWILTGSDRMKKRPIGELVTALKKLGADISYLEKENFPPLKIKGQKLTGGVLEIDGSISSQFVSALLLVAPSFHNNLQLTLKNEIVSWPYIQMTLDLLGKFDVKTSAVSKTIKVSNSLIAKPESLIAIESDWSSASYWYSIVALSKNAEITLLGLKKNSWQGDSVLPQIYKNFGVTSQFNNDELVLTKNTNFPKDLNYDFTNCPDLAQTVAITCFGLGIAANFTGLKTLKIKETDRILALKTELEKFGAVVEITEKSLEIQDTRLKTQDSSVDVETYNDHRMAMSFAPLVLALGPFNIQNPAVVSKSYPLFWEDLKSVGFSVNLQP